MVCHVRPPENLSACGFHNLQATTMEEWKRQAVTRLERCHVCSILFLSRRTSLLTGVHSPTSRSYRRRYRVQLCLHSPCPMRTILEMQWIRLMSRFWVTNLCVLTESSHSRIDPDLGSDNSPVLDYL